MNRFLIIALVLTVAGIACGAFTYSMDAKPNSWWGTGGTKDQLWNFCKETEDYLDGTTGVIQKKAVEVFDANDTLTAAETGKVCVSAGKGTAGDLILTLPTAVAGLSFTFVDANATAADDLWITAATGDKINGGTAGDLATAAALVNAIPQVVKAKPGLAAIGNQVFPRYAPPVDIKILA